MPEIDGELIQGKILHKLIRFGKIGESHTAVENLYKYLPRHMRDQAKEAVEILFRKGILLKKITNYGLQVSLVLKIETRSEIDRLVEKYLLQKELDSSFR